MLSKCNDHTNNNSQESDRYNPDDMDVNTEDNNRGEGDSTCAACMEPLHGKPNYRASCQHSYCATSTADDKKFNDDRKKSK